MIIEYTLPTIESVSTPRLRARHHHVLYNTKDRYCKITDNWVTYTKLPSTWYGIVPLLVRDLVTAAILSTKQALV